MATTTNSRPTFHLPARDVPVPTSVSEAAQAMLAMGPVGPEPTYPPLDDAVAWREHVAKADRNVLDMLARAAALSDGEKLAEGVVVRDLEVDRVRVYEILPEGVTAEDRRLYLDIHGGAWILGGGDVCRTLAARSASSIGARIWAVDYRMPPDHPYPAALDDCLTVYRALLAERAPAEIIVGGGSAGGNLAAALILRARDEGLELPAAAVLNTPATDLTAAGDTWQANDGLDTVLTGDVRPPVLLYAAGHDLRDPYLSPLFGDLAEGFPPTILTSGTRDRLLSDTVRMHRALRGAGIEAELHVWEAAGHGGFLGAAPEDAERAEEVRRFLDNRWDRGHAAHS